MRPIGQLNAHKALDNQIDKQHNNKMVGRGGLEPPTSRLSGVRSNHLSYRPSPDRQVWCNSEEIWGQPGSKYAALFAASAK